MEKVSNFIKCLLVFVFLFWVGSLFAQTNGRFKSIASFNTDSTTVKSEIAGLQLMYDNVGALYYNNQSNKWRIFSNGVWSDFQNGGGGQNYDFDYGLILFNDTVSVDTAIIQAKLFFENGLKNTLDSVRFSGGTVNIDSVSFNTPAHIALNAPEIYFPVNFGNWYFTNSRIELFEGSTGGHVWTGFDWEGFEMNATNYVAFTSQSNEMRIENGQPENVSFSVSAEESIKLSAADSIKFQSANITLKDSLQLNVSGSEISMGDRFLITNNASLGYTWLFLDPYLSIISSDSIYFEYRPNFQSALAVAKKAYVMSVDESAPLNVGTPSNNEPVNNLQNGDVWYNALTNTFRGRKNNQNISFVADAFNGLTIVGDSIRLGGTMTENTTIAQAGFNTTYSGIGTVQFSPSATLAGVNIGSVAGDPSSLSNGDLWYNSSQNVYRLRANGVTRNVIMGSIGGSNCVVYSSSNNVAATSANFTFNPTANVLNVGNSSNGVAIEGGAAGQRITDLNSGALFSIGKLSHNDAAFDLEIFGGNVVVANGVKAGDVQIRGGIDGGVGASNISGGDIVLSGGLPSGTGLGGSVVIETNNVVGGTIKINDGANEQMGVATLVAGTVTVNNVKVTNSTRIFTSVQAPGGTQGFLHISARVAGTSFTITSTSATDTSTVAWLLIEPN